MQANRASLIVDAEPSYSQWIEEAQLAVQIAQVEATERLAQAMTGIALLDESPV